MPLLNFIHTECIWRHHGSESTTYTASQLSGIPLPVPPFCLAAGRNLCQCQYKSPGDIQKTSLDPLTNVYGQSSFLSSPDRSSFSEVLISPVAPKATWRICFDHIPLSATAACKFSSQSKVTIMPVNIPSVIIENTARLSGLGLNQNMVRISRVSPGDIYHFYAVFTRYIGRQWPFNWYWHRFPPTGRQNGCTSKVIPLNRRQMYKWTFKL